jgi:hypothetical protein
MNGVMNFGDAPVDTPIVKRRVHPLSRQPHHPIAECARCRETVPIVARKLCGACYAAVRADGTIIDYPTTHTRWPIAAFAEEYEHLHVSGVTEEQIAVRLGFRSIYYLRQRVEIATARGLIGRRA